MKYDKNFMRSVIDREISLIDVLERLDVVARGSYSVGRSCYCCFHDNHDTPAAKIYDDPRGVTLFCFSEQKSYRSSDAFLVFSKYSLEIVFESIWNKLPSDKKSYYLDSIENTSAELPDEWEQLTSVKMSNYSDFLDKILSIVEK